MVSSPAVPDRWFAEEWLWTENSSLNSLLKAQIFRTVHIKNKIQANVKLQRKETRILRFFRLQNWT